MNADTVSACALSLRTAGMLLDLATGLARTATALATTNDDPTSPQEAPGVAAHLLKLDHPAATPDTPGERQDHELDKLERVHARDLEEDNARLERVQRLAVELHELLGQAVTHLAAVHQARGWDYDRARLLTAARTLLTRDPWGGHDPAQEHADRRDAERLRVAAHTIHTADALHQAVRAGNPTRLDRAADGYERARRLYAQHAAADRHQPVASVVIDTTVDPDHDHQEPADTTSTATVGVRG